MHSAVEARRVLGVEMAMPVTHPIPLTTLTALVVAAPLLPPFRRALL